MESKDRPNPHGTTVEGELRHRKVGPMKGAERSQGKDRDDRGNDTPRRPFLPSPCFLLPIPLLFVSFYVGRQGHGSLSDGITAVGVYVFALLAFLFHVRGISDGSRSRRVVIPLVLLALAVALAFAQPLRLIH